MIATSGGTAFGTVILVVIGLALYWLPTLVAWRRHHHQLGSIFVLNLLLGWTVIGWIVALTMAASATRPAVPPPLTAAPAGWYPDAKDPELLRWWDGARWTEHFQPVDP